MRIDKKEVLRYLGYKGQEINEEMEQLIDELREEMTATARPKTHYEIAELGGKDGEKHLVDDGFPLTGKSIQRLMKGCEKCIVLGATLGTDVERRINYYTKVDLTKGIIFDSCGTQLIEEICDELEEDIKGKLGEGYNYTYRFSPGYGDYPIAVQNKVVAYLDGYRKMGLSVTPTHLLIPRKSVTALVGVSRGEVLQAPDDKCDICLRREYCTLRKEGRTC